MFPKDQVAVTMGRDAMRNTPSLLSVGRNGDLRTLHFGQVPGPQIGAEIAAPTGEGAG